MRGRCWLAHRRDAFPGEGLREADRFARGLAGVGVVQKPFNGRGRERIGHEFVKARWMQIRRDRDGTFLVCSRLGCSCSSRRCRSPRSSFAKPRLGMRRDT